MSEWTKDSRVKIATAGGKNWEVLDWLRWEIGTKGSGRFYDIEPGFISDLASIPRIPGVRFFLSPHDQPQVQAALGHDKLYREPETRPYSLRTKREVDREFRLMMAALGTPWLRRWMMWAAVRIAFWSGEDWGYWD